MKLVLTLLPCVLVAGCLSSCSETHLYPVKLVEKQTVRRTYTPKPPVRSDEPEATVFQAPKN